AHADRPADHVPQEQTPERKSVSVPGHCCRFVALRKFCFTFTAAGDSRRRMAPVHSTRKVDCILGTRGVSSVVGPYARRISARNRSSVKNFSPANPDRHHVLSADLVCETVMGNVSKPGCHSSRYARPLHASVCLLVCYGTRDFHYDRF